MKPYCPEELTDAQRQQLWHNWIAALRDPGRKQARGTLYRSKTGGMCCLGVGCDVFADMFPESCGWVKRPNTNDDVFALCLHSELLGRDKQQYVGGSMPVAVLMAFGMSDELEDTLIGLNDEQRRSFKYIANYLEDYRAKQLR